MAVDWELAEDVCCRMSYYSEDHWAAGWMSDLEFTLWDRAASGDPEASQIVNDGIRSGVWWVWFNGDTRPIAIDDFVPLLSRRSESVRGIDISDEPKIDPSILLKRDGE